MRASPRDSRTHPDAGTDAGDSRPSLQRFRRPLAVFAIWASLLVAWSYGALHLPLPARQGWGPDLARRAPPLARYDSGWYLGIAEHGYGPLPEPGKQSEHVFFPLYPLLVAAVSRVLAIDAFTAGVAVSIAAMLAAMLLFFAEGRRRLGESDALAALLFLLLFPTAFFLISMYAESLFLLLALLAFAAVARRRYAAAAVCGVLAGLTRLPAIALCAPLALAAWSGSDAAGARGTRFSRAVLVGLAPAASAAAWILGVGWHFGEPGLYFRLQRGWGRGVSPLAGLAQWAMALPDRLVHGEGLRQPVFLLEYGAAILFLAIAVWQARRHRWADASWTAGALILPAATGISMSIPRYLVVVYPAFYALAEASRGRPVARHVWWTASAVVLLGGVAAFVCWHFVA